MSAAAAPPLPSLAVHHLKVFVADLDAGLRWWQAALGAQRLGDEDHRAPDGGTFAYILEVPGLDVPVELRLSPVGAERLAGFDPFTFVVEGREALRALGDRWDAAGLDHSAELRGEVGWLIAIRTPDGLPLRFMTRESHPWGEGRIDLDSPWLAAPGGLFTTNNAEER